MRSSATSKLAQYCINFAQVGSTFCQIRNEPSSICQRLVKFCHCGEICQIWSHCFLPIRSKSAFKAFVQTRKFIQVFVRLCQKWNFYYFVSSRVVFRWEDGMTDWLGCPIILVHLKSIKTAGWPDLAKLCHSDKMLKVHAIFDGIYFVFGQIMNLLWQFFSRHWANFHWHKWPIIEQLFKHSIRTEINSGLSSLLWQASSTRLSLCESQFRQNLQ